MEHNKKVKLKLVGLDGNALSLLGVFTRQAKQEGWTKEEIEYVVNKATAGKYSHLVSTLAGHCEDPAGSADSDDYDGGEEQEEDREDNEDDEEEGDLS